MLILIGTGESWAYRRFIQSRGTTPTQALSVVDATTSATWPSDYNDAQLTYTAELTDCEPFEAAKIVSYARVWIIIAFVVILRRLIETRSRAPPYVIRRPSSL